METKETGKDTDIKAVKSRFDEWRRSKTKPGCRIPAELWEKVFELTPRYSISQISRELRLNFTGLKRRIEGKGHETVVQRKVSPFIELPWKGMALPSECVIELEDKAGRRMKMCFRGEIRSDLLALCKTFLGRA